MVDDLGWSISGHTNANLPSCVIKHGWLESTKWSLLAGNSSIFSSDFPLRRVYGIPKIHGILQNSSWSQKSSDIIPWTFSIVIPSNPIMILPSSYSIFSRIGSTETWQETPMKKIDGLDGSVWTCLYIYIERQRWFTNFVNWVFPWFSQHFQATAPWNPFFPRCQTRQNNKRSAMRRKMKGRPSGGLRLGVC